MRLFHLEPSDTQQLAQWLQQADALVLAQGGGDVLSGTLQDLPILQNLIAQHLAAPTPEQLHAVSAALGRVLLHEQAGSEWAIVQGVHQRGYAIRRMGTLHWVSPEGALRSHLHGGARLDLRHLFASLCERLNPPALAA
ncbi:MAG TPA: DUF3806 domain-containing protein [Thiomonas arsenitoxydans]|uniref:DUF3806 domain-containing protein n=1 Tax=Thiomonas TaxID=32012 RepID=UPI00257F03E1|nr:MULTISPECIES: DUF3806 domain-containing protein [Thiomonas]HML80205.1 DUF3806 domain-containing protein [Thiomonas arsenitoxydans]